MLVGRDRELVVVQRRLAQGETAALLGESGVGKTSLLRQAIATSGRRLFEGGGFATLSWLPYLAVERALGRKFSGGDAAWIAREVEHTVGEGVLLLDDLHWIDRETRSLLPLLHGRIALATAIRRGTPETEVVVSELAVLGIESMPVEPLRSADSETLVARVRPDLPAALVSRVVSRSGGNPLLLEELARSGEPTESLRLALAARLRLLSPKARQAMELLALAGRPLDRALLGETSVELVESGLCTVDNGSIVVRHALLAETAVANLVGADRQRLHARLARIVVDSGDAARHHSAAGERDLAFGRAMEAAAAAVAPGERVLHLAVAAANAPARLEDELRLDAAEALCDVGDFNQARLLVDGRRPARLALRARSALVLGRAALADRDLEDAAMELSEAEKLAAHVGGSVKVEVAIALVLYGVEAEEPAAQLNARARHAIALARDGTSMARALHAAALADAASDRRSSVGTLRKALAAARAEADVALECACADLLCRPSVASARRLASEMIARTRSLKLTAWERRFQARLAGMCFHFGEFRRAYESGEELLTVALQPWERYLVIYYTAQAAADLGLHDRVQALLLELESLSTASHESRRQLLWARADTELLAGRPAQALEWADLAFAEFPKRAATFVKIARGWAMFELGRIPEPVVLPDESGFLAGAQPELDAVRALAEGRHLTAASLFSRAAQRWQGQHVRGELRCLWGEGEAIRRAGEIEGAIGRLLRAEQRTCEHEHAPIAASTRRSLRLAGMHRSADRTQNRVGKLTHREREVMTLVAKGLSNAEIARRLGIGRPSVARTVSNAADKLGAATRLQAASRAVRG